jgi:hypothetical protein
MRTVVGAAILVRARSRQIGWFAYAPPSDATLSLGRRSSSLTTGVLAVSVVGLVAASWASGYLVGRRGRPRPLRKRLLAALGHLGACSWHREGASRRRTLMPRSGTQARSAERQAAPCAAAELALVPARAEAVLLRRPASRVVVAVVTSADPARQREHRRRACRVLVLGEQGGSSHLRCVEGAVTTSTAEPFAAPGGPRQASTAPCGRLSTAVQTLWSSMVAKAAS